MARLYLLQPRRRLAPRAQIPCRVSPLLGTEIRLLLLGWLLGLTLLLGCRSDAERRRQADIARLAEHVDRLRSADNRDKRVALSRLNEVGCTETETCALKELCVQAYTLHVTALDTIARLKRQASSDAGKLAASPAAAIAETERQLLEARTLSQSCAEEQVRLVRKALL